MPRPMGLGVAERSGGQFRLSRSHCLPPSLRPWTTGVARLSIGKGYGTSAADASSCRTGAVPISFVKGERPPSGPLSLWWSAYLL